MDKLPVFLISPALTSYKPKATAPSSGRNANVGNIFSFFFFFMKNADNPFDGKEKNASIFDNIIILDNRRKALPTGPNRY